MTCRHMSDKQCTPECITLPKRFPIQPSMEHGEKKGWISWNLAEEAYAIYAKRYPSTARMQSLDRLAERGGFHRGELASLLVEAYGDRAKV